MRIKELGCRARAWVAPAVLITIACTQVYRVHAQRLTPWKGGGFGMFSTVNSRGSRFVRVHLLRDEGGETYRLRVKVPREWRRLARELRFMPTVERARTLAAPLAGAMWQQRALTPDEVAQVADGDGARAAYQGQSPDTWVVGTRASQGRSGGINVTFDAVSVEVLEYTYDPAGGRLVARTLVSVDVPAPADRRRSS